jgi:osmotically-inducible protein OsmY
MPRKKSDPRSVKRDSTLGGGTYHDEGAAEDTPGTWGDQSRQERREEQRGDSGAAGVPRPRRKSDDSLAREIHEILTTDPELDAAEIGVEVEGGAVTLTGEVEHPDAKLLAEEMTESVAGVRLVHNRLVVRR